MYLGFLFLITPLQLLIQKFPEYFIQFAHVSTQMLDSYVEPAGCCLSRTQGIKLISFSTVD